MGIGASGVNGSLGEGDLAKPREMSIPRASNPTAKRVSHGQEHQDWGHCTSFNELSITDPSIAPWV